MNKLPVAKIAPMALICALAGSLALAKLPPPTDAAKAKAAETAAKAAWTGKMDAYLLCKSQDRVAARYYKSAKTESKETRPAAQTPACSDPGPFVYTPPEPKPPEAAAAPGDKKPAAEAASAKKS